MQNLLFKAIKVSFYVGAFLTFHFLFTNFVKG